MANEEIEVLPSDKTTMVPYGFKGEKISIAQMIQTKEFKGLEPRFALNVLKMIRENPSIGILKGGGDRPEETVRNLFYANYRKLEDQKDYENIPSYYAKIKNGRIKWNPEDKQWYKLVTKRVVAVPGGSWHTGGYAVDFTGDTALAGKISKKYNIEQITSTGEKHHFQPAGLPTSKRMFQYLRERYGLDPIANPLPKELIDWLDSEIASNVPRHPERILPELDRRVEAYKKSIAPKLGDALFTPAPPRNKTPYDFGVEPLPVDQTTTTTGAPSTTSTATTSTTTTTVPPTTTTARPTTTTTRPSTTTTTTEPTVAGQRSSAPSASEYGRVRPTTTTTSSVAPTTTTTSLAPRRTTTTTAAPTTTSTTSTTMAPRTTTTTVPSNNESPDSTVPGQIDMDGDLGITPGGGPGIAGGIDPNYKPPKKSQFLDPAKPYVYTLQDWQMLLTMPKADVITIQRNLMQAYPGFKPGSMGNPYDPKTIKYFKSALARINQFSVDPNDSYGLGIRGKSTLDAIKIIAKVPMAAGTETSGSLQPYRLSNKDDLKTVFRKASQDMLGRTIGEGDLNRLVEAYQASELKYQKVIAGGGTAAAAPDPTTFAQSNIEKDFTGEVNVNKLDEIFSVLDRTLSGGQR